MTFEEDTELRGGTLFRHYKSIMEKKLGRSLNKGEIIHHIDRNRQNNHPDNLQLMSSHSSHKRLHDKERWEAGQIPWIEREKVYKEEWYLKNKEKILEMRHNNVETGEFECTSCDRSFKNKKGVTNHARRFHR